MTFKYLCDELPLFEGWTLREFRERCHDNLVSCFQSLFDLGNHRPIIEFLVQIGVSSLGTGTGYSPARLTNLFGYMAISYRIGRGIRTATPYLLKYS
jgi:hypothetical protein